MCTHAYELPSVSLAGIMRHVLLLLHVLSLLLNVFSCEVHKRGFVHCGSSELDWGTSRVRWQQVNADRHLLMAGETFPNSVPAYNSVHLYITSKHTMLTRTSRLLCMILSLKSVSYYKPRLVQVMLARKPILPCDIPSGKILIYQGMHSFLGGIQRAPRHWQQAEAVRTYCNHRQLLRLN